MPTDEELCKMSGHVHYEISEFKKGIEDFHHLRDTKDPARDRALESALLHFRVLRDFFLDLTVNSDDDVLAVHYVGAGSWKPKTSSKVFEETRKHLNKRLAHLSLHRIKESEKEWTWPLDEMNKALGELIAQFYVSLPSDKKDWFRDLKEETVTVTFGLGTANCRTDSGGVFQFFKTK